MNEKELALISLIFFSLFVEVVFSFSVAVCSFSFFSFFFSLEFFKENAFFSMSVVSLVVRRASRDGGTADASLTLRPTTTLEALKSAVRTAFAPELDGQV